MKIKQLVRQCLIPVDQEKNSPFIKKALIIASVIMALICVITSAMNLRLGYYTMASTTIILMVGFIVAAILHAMDHRRAALVIMDLMIVVLFTYYAISGGNSGFAILWILLTPVFCMGFIGIPIGFSTCLYFQILLVVLFYSPLNATVSTFYTPTFIQRFPVLYLADFAGTTVFMVQKHLMQLREMSYEKELEEAIELERKRVSDISLQTILSISNAVDAKDSYTQQHSKRVSDYSCMIAKALGWDEDAVEKLRMIALLHDIGKISISDAILNKTSKLTDEEYAIMKSHTEAGGEILKDLTILENVDLGAKYHHERYDGKGYPQGLAGKDIPLEARIIGIADAFDAMNSNRVYRPHLTPDAILAELQRCKGTQFDPELTDVFLPIAKNIMQGEDAARS